MTGTATGHAAAAAALAAIDRYEGDVHAWTHIDRDALTRPSSGNGPLSGIVVGVKDIIDTADMPTEYGSPIYRGHRPDSDAAVVTALRDAGAILAGKTATAEFAFLGTGPTRNPHRLTHTPGGSSMGSAAAVAAGMADAALGTQTAGSIIRPAGFCGVIGVKPSFGLISTAGVKAVSPSCDTVGFFVRDPMLLAPLWQTLTGRHLETAAAAQRFALLRTPEWLHADTHSRAAVTTATLELMHTGNAVSDIANDTLFADVSRAQRDVMMYEARHNLAWEYANHPDQLGEESRAALDAAQHLTEDAYARARAVIDAARGHLDEWFGDADILLTPAAIGEAPLGLSSTGDPMFARPWTALGLPTAAIPWTTGPHRLPIAVQAIAKPGQDAALLAAVQTIATASSYQGLTDRHADGK